MRDFQGKNDLLVTSEQDQTLVERTFRQTKEKRIIPVQTVQKTLPTVYLNEKLG